MSGVITNHRMLEALKLISEEAGRPVEVGESLTALGLDSLEFLELVLALQTATGTNLSDEVIAKAQTVGELLFALEGGQ